MFAFSKASFAAVLFTCLALPAFAQDLRTVTDHADRVVEVPAAPQRIVSLSDWTTTIMAHELGITPVASVGRQDGENAYHIRSARELYDLGFSDELGLASIHGQLDMERIASFQPDLIVGLYSDTINHLDNLSLIAPVLLFDTENGKAPLDNYADFASWIGKGAEFETLKAEYEARVAAYRASHPDAGALGSYLVIRSNAENGDITLYRTFGAITTVLDDIGFPQHPIAGQIPETEQRSTFSAEMVGEMNADYLFAGHMEDRGEVAQDSFDQLEQVAPGALDFLSAAQNDRFVSVSRFHVSPPTFAAMNYFLDHLEATN